MGKQFVTVASPTQLTSVWVSEFDDGALAYAVSTNQHYALCKTPAAPPNPSDVLPAAGAPRAGSPNAAWTIVF